MYKHCIWEHKFSGVFVTPFTLQCLLEIRIILCTANELEVQEQAEMFLMIIAPGPGDATSG